MIATAAGAEKFHDDLDVIHEEAQRARDIVGNLLFIARPPTGGHVHFRQRGFHLGNLYFEHGHRFERTTTVHGNALLEDKMRLRLPFGSLVNRYVVNRLEGLELFFANIKPVMQLVRGLVRRYPLRCLGIADHAIRVLPRAVHAYGIRGRWAVLLYGSVAVWFAAVAVSLVALVHGRLTYGFVNLGLLALFALLVLAPFAALFGPALKGRQEYFAGEDASAAGVWETLTAERRGQGFKRRYGVVGHTHVADVQVPRPRDATAPPPKPPIWYVNTGTWAPRYEQDRPDLMGQIVHSVVRFQLAEGEYLHECIDWRPEGAAGAPAILFEPTCGN